MKATIKMIAQEAGVSTGTVDRVLHNRPNVRAEVRDRVAAVIEKLNYQPNRAASALAYRSGYLKLAVIYPSWGGYFSRDLNRGIAAATKVMSDFGVEIEKYIYNQHDHQKCLDILTELEQSNVNGIALCAESSMLVREKIDAFAARHIPVVTFNSDIEECCRVCFVGQNTLQSGRVAAEIMSKYPLEQAELLIVLGNYEYSGHKRRVDGFLQRFDELDIPREKCRIIECYNEYAITFEKVYEEVEKNPNIRYIYMANRSVTACVEALKRLHREKAIRIVCHDISEQTLRLLKEGMVDYTIGQDLYTQGFRPLSILADLLLSRKKPEEKYQYTALNIINAENALHV